MPVLLVVLLSWALLSAAVVLGLAALFTGRQRWEQRARAAADGSTADAQPQRSVTRLPLAG